MDTDRTFLTRAVLGGGNSANSGRLPRLTSGGPRLDQRVKAVSREVVVHRQRQHRAKSLAVLDVAPTDYLRWRETGDLENSSFKPVVSAFASGAFSYYISSRDECMATSKVRTRKATEDAPLRTLQQTIPRFSSRTYS